MNIKYLNKEEVESIALYILRNAKDKSLLNNKNVNCFVLGWGKAISYIKDEISKGQDDDFKSYLATMMEDCKRRSNKLHMDLGYAGYQFSRPEAADAMLKLYASMVQNCAYVLNNIENVRMNYQDYYEKLKGDEE